MKTSHQWLMGVLLAVALAGVFSLYIRPDFMVQMVNQMWGCF